MEFFFVIITVLLSVLQQVNKFQLCRILNRDKLSVHYRHYHKSSKGSALSNNLSNGVDKAPLKVNPTQIPTPALNTGSGGQRSLPGTSARLAVFIRRSCLFKSIKSLSF